MYKPPLTHSLLALSALAFSSTLNAQITLTRTLNPYGHPSVEMTMPGSQRLFFDSFAGGAPVHWYLWHNGAWTAHSVIQPSDGSACVLVYETGQDSTQSFGGMPHRIYVPSDPTTLPFNYYCRETLFEPPTPENPQATYEVAGFAPFFWISHNPIDDAIPPHPVTGDHGWYLGYALNCPPGQDCSGRSVYEADELGFTTPIWFDGVPGRTEGVIMVGNEITGLIRGVQSPQQPNGQPWNQRLCEIQEGRVAFKATISLLNASADAYAGILFRKDVDADAAQHHDDVIVASGYELYVNRSGVVQLHRRTGGATTIIWNQEGVVIAPQVATATGAQIEVRTHNHDSRLMEIYADNLHVATVTDPNPHLGPHFGYFAYTQPETSVKFRKRMVWDVGIEFRVRYTGLTDGRIEIESEVRPAPGVSTPRAYYPAGMGGWMNLDPYPQIDTVAVFAADGGYAVPQPTDCAGTPSYPAGVPLDSPCGSAIPWHANPAEGCISVAYITTDPFRQGFDGVAAWAGTADRSLGLYAQPVLAEVDHTPASHTTFGADKGLVECNPNGPFLRFGLGVPFPPATPSCLWFERSQYRMVTRVGPHSPLPLRDTRFVSSQSGIPGAPGRFCTPLPSVVAGAAAVATGGTLRVLPGDYPEPVLINRPMRIEAHNGPVRIGD